MGLKEYLAFVCCLFLTITATDCAKIVIIILSSARSHYNVFTPIIEGLASHKHDITVQAMFTRDEPLPNVRELVITPAEYGRDPAVAKQIFFDNMALSPISEITAYRPFTRPFCEGYLTDESSKTLLAEGVQHDLAIVDALFPECPMAVGSLVAKRMMDIYTTSSFPWKDIHVPTPPSYVPSHQSPLTPKMTFFQRLKNAINLIGVRIAYRYVLDPGFQEIITKIIPQAGTIEELEQKIVFSLTNGDPVMDSPRPSMPNYIHCGGMHCRKANPLPKDLEDFVQSSGEDGFIMFGLGSNMKSEYLPREYVRDILLTFSRLKQKVIWKFEAELDNVPKNVKIVKWMPQQDLLGHPKIRLFITHAGLLSLQEAIYHAVPVIGIPFFADQDGNSARIKDLEIGERLNFFDINGDVLYNLITKIIKDKSYYDNMRKYSAIFKDQPDRPIDRALFWIEYVLRHDGALHLRSAGEDLNFFQYYLLDVAAFIMFVGLSSIGIIVYIIKFVPKVLRGKKHPRCNSDKKQK